MEECDDNMLEQVPEAKFFIGYRDATSNRQGKVVENVECGLTDFNALINSHSSFETSVLKVLYTSRQ